MNWVGFVVAEMLAWLEFVSSSLTNCASAGACAPSARCLLLAHSGLLEQPHRMSAFKGKPDAFSRDLLSPLMTQSRHARLWLDGLYSRWMDRENATRQFPDGFYGGRYGRG
jgi:hypothetical protein